jgi:hypothetical protein
VKLSLLEEVGVTVLTDKSRNMVDRHSASEKTKTKAQLIKESKKSRQRISEGKK